MRISQHECWSVSIHCLLTSEASIKMSVESPGRKAVLQCMSDLTSLLKHNLSWSGKLLEKGLITEAVHDWILGCSSCFKPRQGGQARLLPR